MKIKGTKKHAIVSHLIRFSPLSFDFPSSYVVFNNSIAYHVLFILTKAPTVVEPYIKGKSYRYKTPVNTDNGITAFFQRT